MTNSSSPLVHDEQNQRFVQAMSPSDAFVDYVWQGQRMVLTHIEIDPSLRGTGIGERFAKEVLTHIEDNPNEIRIVCPYLRYIARSSETWRSRFGIE